MRVQASHCVLTPYINVVYIGLRKSLHTLNGSLLSVMALRRSYPCEVHPCIFFCQKNYCRERVVNELEALPTLKAARPPQVYTGSIEWKYST